MRSREDIVLDSGEVASDMMGPFILEVLLDIREQNATALDQSKAYADAVRRVHEGSVPYWMQCGHTQEFRNPDDGTCNMCAAMRGPAGENQPPPPPPPNETTRTIRMPPEVSLTSPLPIPPEIVEAYTDACRRLREPGYGRCRTCVSFCEGDNCRHGAGQLLHWDSGWIYRCGPDFGCIHYEEQTEVNNGS